MVSRSAQAYLQMRDQGFPVSNFHEDNVHFAKNIFGRLGNAWRHIQENPKNRWYYLLGAGFLEAAWMRGKKEHKRNKEKKVWEPLRSTKR